jgi:hypothetical protein
MVTGLPTEFRIFHNGMNETAKGPLLWDDQAAALVMSEYFRRGIKRLHISWEHQDLNDAAPEAPAAGWFTPEVRTDGLYAVAVEWTPRAAQQLRNREYAHHSAAVEFDRTTRRVQRLISDTLTNRPATYGQSQLVAAKDRTDNILTLSEAVRRPAPPRRRNMRDVISQLEKLSNAMGPQGRIYVESHIERLKYELLNSDRPAHLRSPMSAFVEEMRERLVKLKQVYGDDATRPLFDFAISSLDSYNRDAGAPGPGLAGRVGRPGGDPSPDYRPGVGGDAGFDSFEPSYNPDGPSLDDPRRANSPSRPSELPRASAEHPEAPQPTRLTERERRLCLKYGTDPEKVCAAKERWAQREAERKAKFHQ